MSRVHWMKDRVKISRRTASYNRGIIQNERITQGIVEDEPVTNPVGKDRIEASEWIPARLRIPSGDESDFDSGAKVDLAIQYELVMHAWDVNGEEICPKQHDELILKYRRDGDLTDATSRLRITGTIQEVRKRERLYSYVIPVVMHTEF